MNNNINVSSLKKNALLIAPVVIMLTVYLVLSFLVERFGMNGLFYGYFFYWGFWCIIFPLWTVGWEGFKKMFSAPGKSITKFDWMLLALPVIIYAGFRLPEVWPQITLTLVLLSVPVSMVNGTLEELLWRGTYITAFPENRFLGYLFPSVAFGVWHAAPYVAVFGFETALIAGVVGGGFFGFCWGWVAWKTGSIRLAVSSHVLANFVSIAALNFLG